MKYDVRVEPGFMEYICIVSNHENVANSNHSHAVRLYLFAIFVLVKMHHKKNSTLL